MASWNPREPPSSAPTKSLRMGQRRDLAFLVRAPHPGIYLLRFGAVYANGQFDEEPAPSTVARNRGDPATSRVGTCLHHGGLKRGCEQLSNTSTMGRQLRRPRPIAGIAPRSRGDAYPELACLPFASCSLILTS